MCCRCRLLPGPRCRTATFMSAFIHMVPQDKSMWRGHYARHAVTKLETNRRISAQVVHRALETKSLIDMTATDVRIGPDIYIYKSLACHKLNETKNVTRAFFLLLYQNKTCSFAAVRLVNVSWHGKLCVNGNPYTFVSHNWPPSPAIAYHILSSGKRSPRPCRPSGS